MFLLLEHSTWICSHIFLVINSVQCQTLPTRIIECDIFIHGSWGGHCGILYQHGASVWHLGHALVWHCGVLWASTIGWGQVKDVNKILPCGLQTTLTRVGPVTTMWLLLLLLWMLLLLLLTCCLWLMLCYVLKTIQIIIIFNRSGPIN